MKTDDELFDGSKNGEDDSPEFEFEGLSDDKNYMEDDVIELTDIILEDGEEKEPDEAEDDIAVLLDDDMIEENLDLDEGYDLEAAPESDPAGEEKDPGDLDFTDLENDLADTAFEDLDEIEPNEQAASDTAFEDVISPVPAFIKSEEESFLEDIELEEDEEDKMPPEIPLEDFSETVDPLSEEIEKAEQLEVPQEAGISAVIPQERLEEIITAAVERTVEKVVRKTVSDVAEKVIREAIDALKESIEAESK